jgi:hypothetical protein
MPEYGFTISANNLVSAKMKEVEASLESMGVKAKVTTKEVSEHFEAMGERMGETFKNLKGLLLSGLGITALFEGWEFIEKSKEAFEGLEKAVTRVDTVLKSTKFAAGFSSEDIQNQAKELSKVIIAKRDEILDAQGMLLSFHDIRGGTFTQTTKTVADFATFFKESMTDAALQIGKAINDPLKGMTRLQRMGVEFSQTQRDSIKNYVAQGNLVAAQAIILKELNTEFGGQAQAFALTDAGKIQVASKQWEELQFRIGEVISKVEVSLIPAFTKIVNAIKTGFNSEVIQFFIEHIKDLVAIAIKLLPIWIGYKAVMGGVALITEAVAVKNGILALSMGELTVMTDGSTLAFEGFRSALTTTGIGALVVGIGLLIEKFITWNKEIDDTVEKLSGIKQISDAFAESQESKNKIDLAYSNLSGLDKSQKSALYADISSQIKEIQDKLATQLQPQLVKTKQAVQDYDRASKQASLNYLGSRGFGGDYTSTSAANKTSDKLNEALNETQKTIGGYTRTLHDLQTKQLQLQKLGIKPLSYSNPGSGITGDATHTSNLSGASGGLGSAKIIKIDFHGPFQQNVGVKESKSQADEAIEKMTEMLNNFSDSTNSQ